MRSCVLSGGAPTPAGTSMFTMCTHMKCEVKHNGDMGMGHLWLIMGGTFMAYNGWDIYGLMGGAFMAYNGWGIYGLRVWLWLEWVGQL